MLSKIKHGSTKKKKSVLFLVLSPDVSSMEGRVLVVYSFFTDEDDDGDEVFFLFFSEITPRADCGKNRNSLYMVY